jgi:hypothetical protein
MSIQEMNTNSLLDVSVASKKSQKWDIFGKKLPKREIEFFAQITIIYIIVIVSIVNLSIGKPAELWLILVSTSLGCVMPSPHFRSLKTPSQG